MRARGDGDADGIVHRAPKDDCEGVTTTTHRGFVHLLPRGGGELGRPRGGERGGLRVELGELGGRQGRVVVVVAPGGGGDDPPAAVRGGEAADEAAGSRGERGGESGVTSGDDAGRARVAIGRDRRRMPSSRRGARARAGGDPRGDRAASARDAVAHPPAVAERRANPRVSRQARRDHHGARALPRRVPFPTLSASTRRRRCTHATRWTRPLGAFAATLERADANVRRGFEPLVNARACRCGASDAVAARLGPPTTWPNRVGARPPPLRNPAVPWKSRGALTRSSARQL